MSLRPSVAEVLSRHVVFSLESIDRVYLNIYVPQLHHPGGAAHFFRDHRGQPFASSALMAPMTRAFVGEIHDFARRHEIPVVAFRKGERKDDVAASHRKGFSKPEGIVFVGKAQEKFSIFRTERRRNPATGAPYPWIVRSTAMVNAYYFYGLDRDFGPFFLKFASYFPYTARLCLNGHEWLKRQAAKRGIAFEALDNGIASCSEPKRLQGIADSLNEAKIEVFARRWLARLPHPYTAADRAAGFHYDISILQAEFSLTQVLDRPLSGRVFFEEVIRENLDLGRPDQVALIFSRRINRRTPGRFRTRVITEGVVPSLHVDYKHSRIKQYHKEGRALRTETTINDTYDFAIGKRLSNLPALREVGFSANRRLLDVQRISHDCSIGEETFAKLNRPQVVNGQRASALRFADPTVQALLSCLVVFRVLAHGFSHGDLRELLASLLGLDPATMTQGRMSYQLRRLRLHGLIERTQGTHRYQVTGFGLRVALFLTRSYARLVRPGLAQVIPDAAPPGSSLRANFDRLEQAMDHLVKQSRLAA